MLDAENASSDSPSNPQVTDVVKAVKCLAEFQKYWCNGLSFFQIFYQMFNLYKKR